MPIWIIRHVDQKRLGHLTGVLKKLNLPYRSISLSLGDPLPGLDEVSGVITMGGPMSAYEKSKHNWIEKEEEFLRQVHKREIPIFGICLGGQILAQAFGAKVHKAPEGEIGWFPLTKTGDHDDPLLKELDLPPFFQLHYDFFDLPKGAVNLLRSKQTKHQMFRLGKSTYGIQFHPEANEAMLRSVMDEYSKNIPPETAKEILRDVKSRTAKGRKFLTQILRRLFLEPLVLPDKSHKENGNHKQREKR
jgi:GMP synthase (glutamine-hydrolysing)